MLDGLFDELERKDDLVGRYARIGHRDYERSQGKDGANSRAPERFRFFDCTKAQFPGMKASRFHRIWVRIIRLMASQSDPSVIELDCVMVYRHKLNYRASRP